MIHTYNYLYLYSVEFCVVAYGKTNDFIVLQLQSLIVIQMQTLSFPTFLWFVKKTNWLEKIKRRVMHELKARATVAYNYESHHNNNITICS